MNLRREIVVGAQIMMDIAKFFNSLLNKRDLSEYFCNGEEPR